MQSGEWRNVEKDKFSITFRVNSYMILTMSNTMFNNGKITGGSLLYLNSLHC